MTVDLLHYLSNLSAHELHPIVQQIWGPDALSNGALSVTKIGRSAGTATAGIFQVVGSAQTGSDEQPWSAVVKVLGDSETRQEKVDTVAARREMEVYRSGAFASGQFRVRSPKCYAIQEWNELHFIWQEDHSSAPQAPWIPAYYLQTAHHLGQFNAYWPEQSLPKWEWLATGGVLEKYRPDDLHELIGRLSEFQAHPLGSRAITPEIAQALRRFYEEGGELFRRVAATPMGISHGDCHPRNLFPIVDAGAGSFTVAIDWAHVGVENLGSDIGLLLGSPVKGMELSPNDAATLVEPVLDAYLTGLAEAGWSGNEAEVRLTYLTCLVSEATRMTGVMRFAIDKPGRYPVFERLWKRPIEEIFEGWGEAYRFFLSYKDQVIRLASQL